MQARKSLLRAASFLEAIMVRMRTHAYPFVITAIEREASMITLVKSNDDQLRLSNFTAFQPDLASLQGHPELARAVCLHASGVEAMIYFCNIIKDMLPRKPLTATSQWIGLTDTGGCTDIAEVDIVPAKMSIRVSSDPSTACGQRVAHQIYKVSLENGELWAMDITGAQHGRSDLLVPWSTYVEGRSTAINRECSLGFFRSRPARESLHWMSPALSMQVMVLAGAFDQAIPRLVTAHGGSMQTLLTGSGTTYQSTAQRFLGDLEMRLWDIVAKPLTTEGKGMFAARRIARGTRLLAESPVFRVPRDESNLQKLEAVLAQKNTWNDDRGQLTVHALRDIDDGEEITISYLDSQRKQSDQRLDSITYLDERIGDGIGITSTSHACLRMAHEMKHLMEEEGITDARIPRLYYDALQIVIANGDEARARVFAERASAERLCVEGSDSPQVLRLQRYAQNPASHALYGTSKR
ncbi:set domain-containing protein 5 [Colletotrichum chrysophilum]|uniref:Set domain-containing protein 5 n=1 Tax=Colletotrichum chrysophilum TaxID=1836956 RepID=A0AAD9A246_9PEZI|nr:set domain-containing protein 5 [Colletotrichum chrysophilum]